MTQQPPGPPPGAGPAQQGWSAPPAGGPPSGGVAPGWGSPSPGKPPRGKARLLVPLVALAVVAVGAIVALGRGDDDGTAEVARGNGATAQPDGAEEGAEEGARRYLEADSCQKLADATTQAYQADYVELNGGPSAGGFVALCEQARQEGSTIAQPGAVHAIELVTQDEETATVRATFVVEGEEASLELPVRLEGGRWRVDALGVDAGGAGAAAGPGGAGGAGSSAPSAENGRALVETLLEAVNSGDPDAATVAVCPNASGSIPSSITEAVEGNASLAIDEPTAVEDDVSFGADLTGTVDGQPVDFGRASALLDGGDWCILSFSAATVVGGAPPG